MQSEKWELVEVVYGDLQAELLRGLLEAQGIPVVLSQEGAGHNVYPVLMGPLAKVEVLVPDTDLAAAREVVEKYAEAFHKVFSDLDAVRRHWQDPVTAHYRGSLFRAR